MSATLVLGGGCFWCVEAVYQRVKGVSNVVSGYAGGSTPSPTYHNHADHAEVIQITYDPAVIPLEILLAIFFHVHDPTTLNQQGYDKGTAYRSIILYQTDNEKQAIQTAIKRAQPDWVDPIVTEVKQLDVFYPAEDYHQNFFNENQSNPYCQVIINPKLAKFRTAFADYFKNPTDEDGSTGK